MNARLFQIAIIGDYEATPKGEKFAYEVGREVGKRGFALISGGSKGVMEQASRGCYEAGGRYIVGILPSTEFSEANEYCNLIIPTGIGYARNMIDALAGHLVVVIGGRCGTLSEIAYAWQFNRKILAFADDEPDRWSVKVAGTAIDDKRTDKIIPVYDISEFQAQLSFAYKEWTCAKLDVLKKTEITQTVQQEESLEGYLQKQPYLKFV